MEYDDGPPPLEDMSKITPALHQLQAVHNQQLYGGQNSGQLNQARSHCEGETVKDKNSTSQMFSGIKSGFFCTKDRAKLKSKPIVADPSSLIIPEVQDAMKQERQDWLTDDLIRNFVSNPKLLQGMRNPKIVQAMDMMRENPKIAHEKFRNDEEVSSFISSFASVMSNHYSNLASQRDNVASNR